MSSRYPSPSEPTALRQLRRDFLPEALALQDTPPSPAGRALLLVLIALFLSAIVWACTGEIDIVVSSAGEIIPSGHVKIVQAPEPGIVRTVHVGEGQKVAANEQLVTLDETNATVDRNRIGIALTHIRSEIDWREQFGQWLRRVRITPASTLSADQSNYLQTQDDTSLLQHHIDEVSARLNSFARESNMQQREHAILQAQVRRSTASLEILSQRVAALRQLHEKKYGSRLQYLELLQQQTELERTLPVLKSQQEQVEAAILATDARMIASIEESKRKNASALGDARTREADLRQDHRKALQRERRLLVRAPVAGTVESLGVHTEGAVVAQAQHLMKIVPDTENIAIESLLLNKDVGFVFPGQSAQVKVTAFNFTRYGLLNATVDHISDDAVDHQSLGRVFKVRLKPQKNALDIGGEAVHLTPGMAVTAEILTGRRRLIEFFLSPLHRQLQESLKER